MGLLTEYQDKTDDPEKDQLIDGEPWTRPDSLPFSFRTWEEYKVYLNDPRPDLTEDHDRWVLLLKAARRSHEDLFLNLHFLRCGGAKIIKKDTGTYRLAGRYDDTTLWEDRSEWKADVNDKLKPYRDQVEKLLSEVLICE